MEAQVVARCVAGKQFQVTSPEPTQGPTTVAAPLRTRWSHVGAGTCCQVGPGRAGSGLLAKQDGTELGRKGLCLGAEPRVHLRRNRGSPWGQQQSPWTLMATSEHVYKPSRSVQLSPPPQLSRCPAAALTGGVRSWQVGRRLEHTA